MPIMKAIRNHTRTGPMKLKTLLFSTTAISTLFAGSALAQTPMMNWSGWHIGVNIGSVSSNASVHDRDAWFTGLGGAKSYSLDESSVIGGAQTGFDGQSDNLVYGIEGDWDFTDASKSKKFNSGGTTATSELSNIGSVRGRIGIALDQVLLYGTG